jgi:pimeloyl-ACP methyl ester carboxylesterase
MKEASIKAGPATIHYVEEGEGIPLLLVHGNTGSSRWFERTMTVPGCRVLALDLPNFGRSSALEGEVDIDRYADAVAAFSAALGLDRPVLLGHSLGGAVAISLAARHPLMWRRLVLVDSAAPSGLVTPKERHPIIEAWRTNRNALAQVLKFVVPTLKDEAFFSRLVDDAMLMAPPAWIGNAEALSRFDYRGRCGAYAAPVLVLWGKLDALVTEAMANETAKAFPDARFEAIEGVGHSLMAEDPARFVELVGAFARAGA